MANIKVSNNPAFKLDMEETTEETPGSYEEFNPRFAQFLENDAYLKNAIGREAEAKLLAAGETTVTFTTEGITDNSSINVYASVPGVDYTSITIDGNDITIVFEAQEEDIYVKVVVADGMA